MALSMNTNPTSLNAQRNLNIAQTKLAQNLGRLSSGLRINQASDDAAGLGISEKMRAQVRGLAQASRNANDGVSMAQVAEGAMNEQAGILTRLRELAVQGANGTLSDTAVERTYLATEATQAIAELDRISAVTDFNGVKMLGADAGTLTMQVGTSSDANDRIDMTFTETDSATLFGGATLDYSTAAAARTSLDAIDTAISTLSTARAAVGSSQNRLVITMNNLSVARENISAAESRIRDVDVAEETAAMTRNQILSQAGVSVLAQANQLPSAALKLLG
jgi:flagellin